MPGSQDTRPQVLHDCLASGKTPEPHSQSALFQQQHDLQVVTWSLKNICGLSYTDIVSEVKDYEFNAFMGFTSEQRAGLLHSSSCTHVFTLLLCEQACG